MSTLETCIPASTDGELLTLWASHKDPRALEALVHRHGGLVYSLCRKLLRSRAEIDDAFQTVFLLLTKHAHQIRRRESVASWLYSVTVRVCKRMAHSQRETASLPDDLATPMPSSFSQIEFHETSELLARELELLPVKLREPLILVYLEGHSRSTVAELLNTTEDGIKCRLSRGRKLLRSRLLRRGVTFALAFTASSTTVAEVTTDASVIVPTELLTSTFESCQAGELLAPLSSAPITPSSLDSLTLLNQGAFMTSTTWQTLAITTAVAIVLTIGGNSTIRGNSSTAGGREVNTEVSEAAMLPEVTVDQPLSNQQPDVTTSVKTEDTPAESSITQPASSIGADISTSKNAWMSLDQYSITFPAGAINNGDLVDLYVYSPTTLTTQPKHLEPIFSSRQVGTGNEGVLGIFLRDVPQMQQRFEITKKWPSSRMAVVPAKTDPKVIRDFVATHFGIPSADSISPPGLTQTTPPQSLTDVDRQRLIKLMDTVSHRKLSIELERDGRPLTKGKDDLDIKNYELEINLLNKKLDDLRAEYQRIDSPDTAQAKTTPYPATPIGSDPNFEESSATLPPFSFDPKPSPPNTTTPSATPDVKLSPSSTQPTNGSFPPPEPNTTSTRSASSPGLTVQLSSEIPVAILWQGSEHWERVDSKTPLNLFVQPGDKKEFSIRINNSSKGIRRGTFHFRDDFSKDLLKVLGSVRFVLSANDVLLLNEDCPVVSSLVRIEKDGEYKGIDTSVQVEFDTVSTTKKNTSPQLLNEMIAGKNTQENPRFVTFFTVNISGSRPLSDISNIHLPAPEDQFVPLRTR